MHGEDYMDEGTPLSQEQVLERLQSMRNGPVRNPQQEKPKQVVVPQPQVEKKVEQPKEEEHEEDTLTSVKDAIKKKMDLPPPEKIEALKAQHRVTELTVVPLFSENKEGQISFVIIKSLTRAQWRKCSDAVESHMKAGVKRDPMELLQERLVAESIVYPELSASQFDAMRAGFVPTIYTILERISWFFNPENLLNLTITL